MNKNNAIVVIIISILFFSSALIAGKYIIDKSNQNAITPPTIQQQPPIALPPVIQQPLIVQPVQPVQPIVHYYPQYHRNDDFWCGYSDGYHGFLSRMNCPEYNQGYAVGAHDRRCGHSVYYQKYYPPGFHLRLPGLNLNVR